MNVSILTGYLPRDIEVKSTNSGKSVATFSLGVKRPFTTDTTDYFTVVAWNKTAEYLGKYGKKGAFVEVQGSLRPNSYESKDGQKVTTVEIYADVVKVRSNTQKAATETPTANIASDDLDEFEDVLSSDGVPF